MYNEYDDMAYYGQDAEDKRMERYNRVYVSPYSWWVYWDDDTMVLVKTRRRDFIAVQILNPVALVREFRKMDVPVKIMVDPITRVRS